MGLIGRYIFRIAGTAFLIALIVLTAVVWVTTALKEIDVITTQGQTLMLFFLMTSLAIPALVMVIGPIALFIASLYALNRLNADSELVIINASGASRMTVAKPFIVLGILVTLLTGAISTVVMPECARMLRTFITQIRADVLTFIVQPGRFTSVEKGLTFHIRERRPDGTLVGLLVHDQRNPEEKTSYLAEEGRIIRTEDSAYLVMDRGSLQQRRKKVEESNLVQFDRYVFDLSELTKETEVVFYKPREWTTWDLMFPDTEDKFYQRTPGRFTAELHERLSSVLYPLAFVFICLATVGFPRTNRQGRGNAIFMAIVAVALLRATGFAIGNLAGRQPWAIPMMYLIPVAGTAAAGWIAFGQGRQITRLIEALPTISVDRETVDRLLAHIPWVRQFWRAST